MSRENKKYKKQSGFTLVELIAVIAILAVLLIFAVPNMMKYISAAHRATAGTEAQIAADAVQRYLDDQRESGSLTAGKVHKLMNMELNTPDCLLKNYISGGQKEAKIVSVDVDLTTGRLVSLVYETKYSRIKLTINEDGIRTIEDTSE